MSFNFKKFEDRNSRVEGRITVTGSYSFGLPTQFYKDNGIADYKYAVLFWDEENKAVGIHFTNAEEEKGKFAIVKTRDYGAMLSAKSFFTKHQINPKEYKGRYDWEKHNEPAVGQLFVIKLVRKEEKAS